MPGMKIEVILNKNLGAGDEANKRTETMGHADLTPLTEHILTQMGDEGADIRERLKNFYAAGRGLISLFSGTIRIKPPNPRVGRITGILCPRKPVRVGWTRKRGRSACGAAGEEKLDFGVGLGAPGFFNTESQLDRWPRRLAGAGAG